MAFEIDSVSESGGQRAHEAMLEIIAALAEDNGWQIQRFIQTGDSHELILKGEGLSGQEEIFTGVRTYQNEFADYYNLAVAGFTGYVAGNAWSAQPGFLESGVPAHNQHIDYTLAINPQRIAMALKVGTPVYESAYVGKMLPYARPTQYPYPLVVGGMLNGAAATRYSDTSHSMPYIGSRPGLRMRWLDGSYIQPRTYPWQINTYLAGGGSASQLRDTGGSYPVLPVILNDANNLYGELDGIFYVSNFNNTVESVIQMGGTEIVDNPAWTVSERVNAIVAAGGMPYVCFQDVARTSFTDYYAMRLD